VGELRETLAPVERHPAIVEVENLVKRATMNC
jgi:hypothetical protein